ncbi:hypothetical protein IVB36_22575 [Bradyrhizobium sp. 35]|uniref:PGN_0703 family putative restriction endonuclease n=1 Tax=Bradyrhizobium sp. 35 TaxID=2782670 RepID=UPI001FF9BA3D|nr:hypothetical protein [Bradyrhizobium sp. 35]MCK1453581.1 hypothetical protein [Bradyrhizobium sp. 35]
MSNTNPAAAPHSSGVDTKRSKFVQLCRTPWIPERLLREYGGRCSYDSKFRRAARILQIIWMRHHNIPSAIPDGERNTHLGSHLSAEAADAGLNFLSPAIHLLAVREMLLREENAAYDEDRLVGNALSSQPLVFNAFGPLALDLKLATKVFRQLLPSFVQMVDKVTFEHSPGRRVGRAEHDDRWLADRSAVDVALHVRTPEGESGIIYCEIKYSEDQTGPAARWRDRYDQALKQVRLYKDPSSRLLRSVELEQLTREHALSQLAVDNGVTPRAMFIAIGPRLNRRVQAAFQVYANELLPLDESDRSRVAFRHFTLEAFIDAIDVAGDQDTADRLWQRYCNFQRVYDAALSLLAPKAQPLAPTGGSSDEDQLHRKQDSKPSSRRRSSATAKSDQSAAAPEANRNGQ